MKKYLQNLLSVFTLSFRASSPRDLPAFLFFGMIISFGVFYFLIPGIRENKLLVLVCMLPMTGVIFFFSLIALESISLTISEKKIPSLIKLRDYLEKENLVIELSYRIRAQKYFQTPFEQPKCKSMRSIHKTSFLELNFPKDLKENEERIQYLTQYLINHNPT